jgi:N utilization substance protein B
MSSSRPRTSSDKPAQNAQGRASQSQPQTTARHRAREVALQLLYRFDSSLASGQTQSLPEGPELARELTRHFEHFQVSQDLRGFAAELVVGTLSRLAELDTLIEARATNWKLARMASLDRCLLRMAAYEMRHFTDIPRAVTIDEAVELAKQFGSGDSAAFVNGILDSID